MKKTLTLFVLCTNVALSTPGRNPYLDQSDLDTTKLSYSNDSNQILKSSIKANYRTEYIINTLKEKTEKNKIENNEKISENIFKLEGLSKNISEAEEEFEKIVAHTEEIIENAKPIINDRPINNHFFESFQSGINESVIENHLNDKDINRAFDRNINPLTNRDNNRLTDRDNNRTFDRTINGPIDSDFFASAKKSGTKNYFKPV